LTSLKAGLTEESGFFSRQAQEIFYHSKAADWLWVLPKLQFIWYRELFYRG